MKCRNCKNTTKKFMTFGKMPIANAFIKKNQKEYFFELAPCYCNKCSLFQLVKQPEAKKLFHKDYAFFAGTSIKMQNHFKNLAVKLIKKFKLKRNDLTIEIGNNDGGVVHYLSKKGYEHLGIDPSANVVKAARSKGVNMLCDFFNLKISKKIKKKAKFFIAQNTLAHIADINSVFRGISNILSEDGIMISEDPYLVDMLNKGSYDQIYDEHVFIFSLTSMSALCKKFNLQIFDVERLKTAGGSMRYYICRKNKKVISKRVIEVMKIENRLKLKNLDPYIKFRKKCENSKKNLIKLLVNLKKDNKTIVGYGATSKSTTIFNYCNIGPDLIDYITDTTPTKVDKFSPGKHIPIKSYRYFNKNYPDYSLLLAWNHQEEILKKEKNKFSKKGKWIIHLPKIKIR